MTTAERLIDDAWALDFELMLARAGGQYVGHPTECACRYEFPDGSALVQWGSCWGVGYRDCWCYADDGHDSFGQGCQGV